MRCLIGYFGLARSLRYTIDSIRSSIETPLRQAGIPVLKAGHFNLPEQISNARSGENRVACDPADVEMLGLDVCLVEPQSDATIASWFDVARAYPDRFGDSYRSAVYLCHQLHSLDRVWALLESFKPAAGDVVLLLRPDLLYVDALDPDEDFRLLTTGTADLVVPSWQSWGGLNDRFAFCTPYAARIYATRCRLIEDACAEQGGLHAESLLAFAATCHGLRVGVTGLRAFRVRADGRVAANDVAMMVSDA